MESSPLESSPLESSPLESSPLEPSPLEGVFSFFSEHAHIRHHSTETTHSINF
jgi:hypothetical protein